MSEKEKDQKRPVEEHERSLRGVLADVAQRVSVDDQDWASIEEEAWRQAVLEKFGLQRLD